MPACHVKFGSFLTAVAVSCAATPVCAAEPVSFRNDVMAVLSRAGCNQGTCHGNANGKGGLKISLRGDDPAGDFLVLTHGELGRRVNIADADASLLLLKPTMQVPHEGGKRFEVDSREYRILREWIAGGLRPDAEDTPTLAHLDVSPAFATVPADEAAVPIRAEATFSDGTTRDVTGMAVFEPSEPTVEISPDGRVSPSMPEKLTEITIGVRFLDRQQPVTIAFLPARESFTWQPPTREGEAPAEPPAAAPHPVDESIFAKLQRLQINPSPICDDSTFVRRAYLDLHGQIPTAQQAREFVDSDDPAKRPKLVDELLEQQAFVDWWTLKWADLLRNEQKVLDRKGVANFQAWIRSAIGSGMPMNEFAREILASRGSTYASPASNYYRAMRDPIMRAESAAQVFLGVRLQCAKCHNHPFDRWTQDDYYGWANLFARVDYKVLENNRRDSNDKHEFNGEQIVYQKPGGSVKDPRTGKPADPQLLTGMMETAPDTVGRTSKSIHQESGQVDEDRTDLEVRPTKDEALSDDPLAALADWVADPHNRQFARLQVNRIWAELFGRGLVEPVDDFRGTNPATHPELLEWLTDDFIAHGYDLRHTIRTICASQTYQLSAQPNATNADDTRNYSHAVVRRLSAEQLLDSLSRGLDVPLDFNDYPVGMRAAELPGSYDTYPRYGRPSAASQFLTLFGKPPRLQACSCERSPESTLAQSFQLISGRLLHEMLTQRNNRLDSLTGGDITDSQRIETLYWSLLTRPPTSEERQTIERSLSESDNPRRTLEDVAWALLNSGEFLLRR
jgi:hypothetical protein